MHQLGETVGGVREAKRELEVDVGRVGEVLSEEKVRDIFDGCGEFITVLALWN